MKKHEKTENNSSDFNDNSVPDRHMGNEKNTTVWGTVIQVNDVIVPHDIPAVAVEINKKQRTDR